MLRVRQWWGFAIATKKDPGGRFLDVFCWLESQGKSCGRRSVPVRIRDHATMASTSDDTVEALPSSVNRMCL